MLIPLLIVIAACVVFGVFTTAKWLLIIAAIAAVLAFFNGRNTRL